MLLISFNLLPNRDDKRTEDATEFKVRVLFFSISAKLESIHENSEVKGFVRIDHYSSSRREWKTVEFDGSKSYCQALDEVRRIEAHMCDIPNIVSRTPYVALPHLRMVVTPNVSDGSKIAIYLELQNKMNAIQVTLAEVNGYTDFCSDSEIEKLKRLLTYLKDVDIGNCSWEFLESITVK